MSGSDTAAFFDDKRRPLKREGEAYVGEDGGRYPIVDGVVRMLGEVNPQLAAELAAQEAGLSLYLDPNQLLIAHEDEMVARVSRMLGDFRGRILDVGCGKGVLGRLLPHLDLTGLDACFTLVQKATIGYRARVEAVAESLPFADASFDAVVSLNALHHIGDPPRAIQEIARVLRPGGPLITVDPRTVTAVELAKKLLRRGDPAYAPTHRSFGVEEYRELLTGEGAFQPPQIELVGCTALLFAGGMDSLKLSSRYEAIKTIFAGLIALDRALLSRAPFGALGLNIMARTTKA